MLMKILETKQAVNVSGVTVAKRHIADCFNGSHMEQLVYRYLTLVPFLNDEGDSVCRTESQIYLWQKAKRIYKALGLSSELSIPFMLAMMAAAGDLPDKENLGPATAAWDEPVLAGLEKELLGKTIH
jgi:hypothetical protein